MAIGRRGVLAAAAALAAGRACGAAKASRPRRDLDGTWTGASFTNLERPNELTRLVMTPQEAEAWEAPRRAQGGMAPSKPGEVGQAESEFNERGAGMMRVNGEIRSSLIVDPPDGRLPYTTAFREQMGLDKPPVERLEGPEVRPLSERCLFSTLSGAPMIPGPDTSLLQFVQTADTLAIVCEKYHEVRIIPIGTGLAARPRAWGGTSAAHWAGETLVVETAGGREGAVERGQRLWVSGATRVTERFTRLSPGEILYAFDVTDPDILTRPWRGEMRLLPSTGRIFEYACHEGNYGLADILSTARQAEGRQASR